jgi:hypothetical protein
MAIYAWRWWEVIPPFGVGELYLRGAYAVRWPVGEPLHATCSSLIVTWDVDGHCGVNYPVPSLHNSNGTTTPDPNCYCGIYALKQPGKVTDIYPPHRHGVLGVAEIWGKIITAEFGYRAEYAQIRALVDAPTIVCTRYDVPNLPSIEYAQQEYFA